MSSINNFDLETARILDESNVLSKFRNRFYTPENTIYMDGNSLGLLSKDSEDSLMRVLDEWKTLGIDGWMNGKRPWFNFGEEIGDMAASLVGAESGEVVFTGTTTINIHNLTGSFYNPDSKRNKILADVLNFPSDLYALKGQLMLRGLDPGKYLVLAQPDRDGLLDEDEIIEQMEPDVSLVFLPSVLYRSGQLLDIEKLTAAAHARGIMIGFDCSHSVGAIPHSFNEWGVDFALWCSYKYLNGGPGAAAFLYVNKNHFHLMPSLPGWFGNDKEKQFEMLPDFIPAIGAGRWQISSPGILGSSPVEGSMKIILEAGINNIRRISLQLTEFLAGSLNERIVSRFPHFRIITPASRERRGGHIAIEHPDAAQIFNILSSKGIVADLRPPNIIRLAPVALYNSFEEICRVTDILEEIMQKENNFATGL
jgi:kynureninase